MGYEEIYPRGLFIDFVEASSRNYFLEEQKPRDVNTRFFSRILSLIRDINRENRIPREEILVPEMTVNHLKITYLIIKKIFMIEMRHKIICHMEVL